MCLFSLFVCYLSYPFSTWWGVCPQTSFFSVFQVFIGQPSQPDLSFQMPTYSGFCGLARKAGDSSTGWNRGRERTQEEREKREGVGIRRDGVKRGGKGRKRRERKK